LKVFRNAEKYYGRKSPVGRDVCRLRKAYYNARHEASAQIDEIVGETASEADSSETSVSEKENGHEKDDDVIRCICGLYKDEGLMIQCDKCMVWQHCDCMGVNSDVEHYLCEQCDPRPVDREYDQRENKILRNLWKEWHYIKLRFWAGHGRSCL
ncbi:ASH1L isoform 5, partial [Pan troglodytes]